MNLVVHSAYISVSTERFIGMIIISAFVVNAAHSVMVDTCDKCETRTWVGWLSCVTRCDARFPRSSLLDQATLEVTVLRRRLKHAN